MVVYSKEQIEKAREMDLLTYLRNYDSFELVHFQGNVYCTRMHDSLKISNGKWMWWHIARWSKTPAQAFFTTSEENFVIQE